MALPRIVYNPGTGAVAIDFVRGPRNFSATWKSRVHDNLSTSGVRERVVEANDIIISFEMPSLLLNDDLVAWTAFIKFALGGGVFDFTPNLSLPDFYPCVLEDDDFKLTRVAPARFSASFSFRPVPGLPQTPADPTVVMRRFYGYAV